MLSDEERMKGKILGEIIEGIVENTTMQIKIGKLNLDDVNAMMCATACFQEFTFNFMRALALVWYAKDPDKMGDVNQFISLVEAYYRHADEVCEEIKEE